MNIFSEFADVLCDTAKWEAEAVALDAITPNMMYAALIGLVLTGACEFDIRILERLLAFPYQWLMLVHSPPHVECPLRKNALASCWIVSLRVLMYLQQNLLCCGMVSSRRAKHQVS